MLSLFDADNATRKNKLDDATRALQSKYGRDIVKPASVLRAEKRMEES